MLHLVFLLIMSIGVFYAVSVSRIIVVFRCVLPSQCALPISVYHFPCAFPFPQLYHYAQEVFLEIMCSGLKKSFLQHSKQ